MLRMNSLTLENIDKMQEKRIARTKELLANAKTEQERKVLERRLWMLQNS